MTVSTGALHPPHNISKKHQVLQQHDFRFPPNKNKSITSVKKDNSSVAVGFDRVQLPISSHGIKECFGEGPIYSPWETPQKKVGQKMTGENREDMFHEANGIASLGGNFDGFTDRSDKQILLKSDAKRCYLPVDSRVHLIDLLEGLASLDDYGIFSDPVEDSLCIKYSNINRKPMTFSMMRKKIDSEGYTSWRSFVDDFESICYNAMEYYQKHSKFWKAANSILCQGRAYLDQNAEKADEIFGCFTRTQTLNGDEDCEDSNKGDGGLGNEMIQEMECHNSRCNAYFTGNALLGKASFQPDVMKVDQLTGTDAINPLPTNGSASNVSLFTSCITSLGRIQELEQKRSKMHNLSGLPLEADDSVVDIIDCARDDIRFDFPEQATECSSSFGGTDIDDGYDSGRKETFDAAEVESQLLNANKAATPASIKRRKNPLSLEWKAYRCGIEWRCRWLELQIKELQSQASKYDHLLEGIRAKKSANNQHFAKASTARVAPLICDSQRQRILHRKPKKKVENTRDFSTYMSQHPLHSLYEKNKRMEADEIPIDDTSNNMASEQIQQCCMSFSLLYDFFGRKE